MYLEGAATAAPSFSLTERYVRVRKTASFSDCCCHRVRSLSALHRDHVSVAAHVRVRCVQSRIQFWRLRARSRVVDQSQPTALSTSLRDSDDARRVQLLARALDSAIRIPGTSISFGLDSIVGLVPVAGDLASALMSGYIVLTSARIGVPPSVVTRMILNLGVDTLVGSVPLFGDLFDVGFRANLRNAALLDRHLADPGSAKRSSRLAVAAAVGGVILLAAGGVALAIFAVRGLNWLARL